MPAPKQYLGSAKLADRYGWSPRTVARRIKSPPPGFPLPININGRWHWAEDELEAYERSLASGQPSQQKAA